MKQSEFAVLVEQIRKETTELLVSKGREYAGDEDRLANFKRGAALTGAEPLTVLFIYMSKHYDALATYVRDQQDGDVMPVLSEPITGRLADLINYAILAWALIVEKEKRVQEAVKEVAGFQVPREACAGPGPKLKLTLADGSATVLATWEDCRDFLAVAGETERGNRTVAFRGMEVVRWAYMSNEVQDIRV